MFYNGVSWPTLSLCQLGSLGDGFDVSTLTGQISGRDERTLDKVMRITKCQQNSGRADMSRVNKSRAGFKTVTARIDGDSVLSDCMSAGQEPVLVCGLHTCGSLATHVTRMFVREPRARALCLVACCYHAMSELYDDDHLLQEYATGFPMSACLNERRYKLGRNARMLASQSVDRLAQHKQLCSESLLYRAVLQVILRDHLPPRDAPYVVGRRVFGKTQADGSGFVGYVRACLRSLALHDLTSSLTDPDIERYWEEYRGCGDRLARFTQYRYTLAPCVETVILLDRLCYLLEQDNVQSAHIVKLFDATISPRCYAVIAIKH